MNSIHHAAVDTAAIIAADCSAEMTAAVGVLNMAHNGGELTHCQHAIVCAEAVLDKIMRQLGEVEMALRAVAREMEQAA